jgi:NifU-like protein involved in Fe-S cluster formation/hemerythrin
MAKNDLITGSIWDEYSNQVIRRMDEPTHQGEITEEIAKEIGGKLIVADFGAESCGDAVRLYWVVDETTDVIKDSKFKSFGCGTAIASSDVMAELCIGKTVDEAVKITNIDVEFALRDHPDVPAVPPQKMHCSVMAYDVIKKAAGTIMSETISSYLTQDHRACDEEFANMENAVAAEDWAKAEELSNKFSKDLEHHFSMEEEIMFPAFEQKTGMMGGPTAMMRMEHDQMRGVVAQMNTALASKDKNNFFGVSESLMMLMQQHNMKEEQMLYAMADAHLANDVPAVVEQMKAL